MLIMELVAKTKVGSGVVVQLSHLIWVLVQVLATPLSYPAFCKCAWESSGQWLKPRHPATHMGVPEEASGSWLPLALPILAIVVICGSYQ